MKKILALLLAFAMIFAMTACKPQIMDGDGMVNEAEPCTLYVSGKAEIRTTVYIPSRSVSLLSAQQRSPLMMTPR